MPPTGGVFPALGGTGDRHRFQNKGFHPLAVRPPGQGVAWQHRWTFSAIASHRKRTAPFTERSTKPASEGHYFCPPDLPRPSTAEESQPAGLPYQNRLEEAGEESLSDCRKMFFAFFSETGSILHSKTVCLRVVRILHGSLLQDS